MVQHDQSRRAAGPAADGQQAAAAFRFQALFVPDFNFQPRGFGDPPCFLGERFGVHSVRRFVNEPSRQVNAFAEHSARFQGLRIDARPHDFLKRIPLLFRPVQILTTATDHGGANGRLLQVVVPIVRRVERDASARAIGQFAGRGADCLKNFAAAQRLSLAQADNGQVTRA